MKTLLIAVFVLVFMSVSPVKAELFKLGAYRNCAIYEETDEFTDKLTGFHFISGDDCVVMSVGCNKKDGK